MSELVHLDHLDCDGPLRREAEDWLEKFWLDCNEQKTQFTYPYSRVSATGFDVLFTWTKGQPPYKKLVIKIGNLSPAYERHYQLPGERGMDMAHVIFGVVHDLDIWRLLWHWFWS